MILASKSPRRKEILENFGIKALVKVKEIEEISEKEGIKEQIMDIAFKKCIAVAEEYPKEYVLAADTVVVFNKEIIGKPKTEKEAREILKKLSGNTHKVITAYSFINKSENFELMSYDISEVTFRELSADTIDWYIETNEAFDKAGAYGVQGKGTVLVKEIKGDFFNIMGFPLSEFINNLVKNKFNINDILGL